jgi:hypothetical protein
VITPEITKVKKLKSLQKSGKEIVSLSVDKLKIAKFGNCENINSVTVKIISKLIT